MYLRQLFLHNNIAISYFLNCLLTYISAGLMFYKSLNANITTKKRLLLAGIGILQALVYTDVCIYSSQLAQVISFAGSTATFSLSLSENRNKTVAIGFISNGFAHSLRFISMITVSLIFSALGIFEYTFFVSLAANALLIIQAELISRFRRFRNGIQFFQSYENLGVGLFLSSLVFILSSVDMRHGFISDASLLVLLVGITMSGIGIFIWVKANITRYYKSKLRDRDATMYLKELESCEEELDRLRRTNELLSSVVHRDSHLFAALGTAASDAQSLDELSEEIRTLIRERTELIENEIQKSSLIPETGDKMIDSTIHALALRAEANHVRLVLNVTAPVTEIIGDKLSRTALQTLISDHVKDAITAVQSCSEAKGKMLLNLARDGNAYTMTIFDNGVPFDTATYDKLGRERYTSHPDSGGTGIGFMQTFDTLSRCKCSLIITEFDGGMPYTKSAGFRFDGKGRFIIKSPRAEEIKNALTREDVSVKKL